MITTDKWLHFFLSFGLALYDQGLAVALGVAKELWDLLGHGVAEWVDLAANALGILLAGAIS